MKKTGFLIIGLTIVMVQPLWADSAAVPGDGHAEESAYLIRHEKHLKRMQDARSLDTEHTRQAQEEYRKGTAEMSGHAEQHAQDVQDLGSVENQITAGRVQKSLAHEAYKDTVQKYGVDHPSSTAAKQSWKESKEAMDPLYQNRRTLKEDVHRGGRLVHNEKTVLGVQKRAMDSDARYRAMDDRQIEREENIIAGDQRAMTQSVRSSEPPSPTNP